MATIKQKRLVKNVLSGKFNSKKEAMLDAKFSENSSNNPHLIFEGKGIKEIMEKCGLTNEFLAGCLKEDIVKKPQKRAAELRMGFELQDSFPDKKVKVEIYDNYSDEELADLLKQKMNLMKLKDGTKQD